MEFSKIQAAEQDHSFGLGCPYVLCKSHFFKVLLPLPVLWDVKVPASFCIPETESGHISSAFLA